MSLFDGVASNERLGHAMPLAAACLYAVLRRDDRMIDLTAVGVATEQAMPALALACQRIRRTGLWRVWPNDPTLYTKAFVAYFEQIPQDTLRALGASCAPDVRRVHALCGGLCEIITSYELPHSVEAPSFAYAMVMHAVEGACARAMRVRGMAWMAPSAAADVARQGVLVSPVHVSPSTVLVRYAEIEKMLASMAESLPWIANRPLTKRERDRRRVGALRLARSDVVKYMSDVLEVASRTPKADVWTHVFGVRREARPLRTESVCMAERLGLATAEIERMTEAEVDAKLFSEGELGSYMRSPAEQEVWSQLKGWDRSEAHVPAPPETQDRPVKRTRTDAAHLFEPLVQDTDGASDWDG